MLVVDFYKKNRYISNMKTLSRTQIQKTQGFQSQGFAMSFNQQQNNNNFRGATDT